MRGAIITARNGRPSNSGAEEAQAAGHDVQPGGPQDQRDVGLIEKLRQDPKAYARTPQHEQGADLATAALRYVLDEQEWKAKSPWLRLTALLMALAG
jgi:hypothetical protein